MSISRFAGGPVTFNEPGSGWRVPRPAEECVHGAYSGHRAVSTSDVVKAATQLPRFIWRTLNDHTGADDQR